LVITDKDDAKRKMVASRLSPDNRYCRVLELPIHPGYGPKTLALLFGVVFLLIGILGFVPAVGPNEMLLNIFHVNAAHNAVHLLTGVIALVAGMAGVGASKTFFKIFGVVYGLVAVLGFVVGDGMLLGLISNNTADTWLHVGIAVVSLIIGFAPSGEPTRTAA
jgi:uncharacterized protein DUF4383